MESAAFYSVMGWLLAVMCTIDQLRKPRLEAVRSTNAIVVRRVATTVVRTARVWALLMLAVLAIGLTSRYPENHALGLSVLGFAAAMLPMGWRASRILAVLPRDARCTLTGDHVVVEYGSRTLWLRVGRRLIARAEANDLPSPTDRDAIPRARVHVRD